MIISAGDKALRFLNTYLPAKPGPVVAHPGPALQTRKERSRPGKRRAQPESEQRNFWLLRSIFHPRIPALSARMFLSSHEAKRCAQGWERLWHGWDPKQGIPLGFALPITETPLPQGQPEPVTAEPTQTLALPSAPKPLGSLKSGMTTPQSSVSPKKGLMPDSPSWKHQEPQRK